MYSLKDLHTDRISVCFTTTEAEGLDPVKLAQAPHPKPLTPNPHPRPNSNS